MASRTSILWRYTDLPALFHMLRERKITLLSPGSWDDDNDKHYMEQYRKQMRLSSVLALCFTRAPETYHHWHVFAGGPSGVRVGLHEDKLRTAFQSYSTPETVRFQNVKYARIRDVGENRPKRSDLPFLKRYPFRDEKEFRIIFKSKQKPLQYLRIEISLDCIEKITLSPWLAEPLTESVKRSLWAVPGCRDLQIVRSTLISNEEWKSYAEN